MADGDYRIHLQYWSLRSQIKQTRESPNKIEVKQIFCLIDLIKTYNVIGFKFDYTSQKRKYLFV